MQGQRQWFDSRILLFVALIGVSAMAAWALPGTGPHNVQVCHKPPGNPANAHTITISDNALPAHLAHGDFVGPCSSPCACPDVFDPVCCSGVTYANQCAADCAGATACVPGVCP